MKDGFFKKELVIGIIVLFVGAGIVPTFGRTIGNLNNEEVERTGTINGEIWVNGSNTEGPWDGTEEHPYRYIQEGVDNADPYDTMIYVADCTYYEFLTVDVAGIKLEGESRENTIIDGSEDYSVVRILGDDIELVNFTITNSGELNYGLRIGASDVKIHKCDIVGNYFGVNTIFHLYP